MSHLDGYSDARFLLSSLTRRDVTFTVSYLNGERETLSTAALALATHWTHAWDQIVQTVPVQALQEAFDQRRTARWCQTLVEISPWHS
jgi:hypothetical protein